MNKIDINVLEDIAYQKVKEMILNNQLKSKEKIVQDKLAESLGISRTPLRSALRRLESEYLVESIPRKGVVVKKFTDKEVIEVYDCRIALECMAIQLFIEKASDEDIEELANIFSPFTGNCSIDNVAYQKADFKFHETIINKSGNTFLTRLVNHGNLLNSIERIGLVRPPAETLQEHIEIIDAIKARDLDKAGKLCKDHLMISKNLILQKKIDEK